jgi:hypothetical protein
MAKEDDDVIPLVGADEEPLPLEEGAPAAGGSGKIHAFGSAAVGRAAAAGKFQRLPTLTGAGAIRCRIFNSKITVGAMDHMVQQINEWLDHNEIEVKHVNEVNGTLEGKTSEPNIIVTIWY